MNPLAAVILLGALLSVVSLPRRGALIAMVIGILYLTQSSGFLLADFNIFPTRLLAAVCFFRVIVRKEFSFKKLTTIDRGFMMLYLFTTAILLVSQDSIPLHIAKFGDVFFGYFGFRGLIADTDDFEWLLRALVLLLIPYMLVIGYERTTFTNLFSLVGGRGGSWIREGTARCFGSFRNPDLLGALGSTFFPLFVALGLARGSRLRAWIGVAFCTVIVVCSNSGGPLSAWGLAVVGWCLWPIRKHMKSFRLGLVGLIMLLALVMKAPIWYLIARVSSVTGGGGWHRSYLIDVAIRHFGEWWFVGMPIEQTRSWFPYILAATGGADITNQFISFALNGGVIAVILLITLLTRTFRGLGTGLQVARAVADHNSELLLWGFGVMQAVHITTWLGITYFDQFELVWLLQLAALATICNEWLLRNAAAGAFSSLGLLSGGSQPRLPEPVSTAGQTAFA